ncbi:TonB family protein [Massilia sp. CCM 8695]|uniref:TonB family protein n=2 Tax=Massilia frigida TaxID=2609281 RepID=A0ABX0MY37_9BURK|nr:TonB family protein [Massilia frigida]
MEKICCGAVYFELSAGYAADDSSARSAEFIPYPSGGCMFATTRFATVLSATLLCLSATQAMAEDRPARLEVAGCEKPEFPVRWQDDGESGTVTIAYLVDTDGKVVQSKVLESSGAVRVDRASVRAGARCKFEPGAKDGQAALAWAKVKYSWVVE